MNESSNHFYEFGPFRIDAFKRRLMRDGITVPLTPKAFETLLVLVQYGGELVEKDALMEKVWPRLAVEENNLTQNISALRKALGEKRDDPAYILTVPGSGYRFIPEVRESCGGRNANASEDDRTAILTQRDSAPAQVQRKNCRQRSTTLLISAIVIAIALATAIYLLVTHSTTIQ